MMLYVVRSDDYILGIFDSRELAELRVKWGLEGHIEELPLNPDVEAICRGCVPYLVMVSREGDVMGVVDYSEDIGSRPLVDHIVRADEGARGHFHVLARDEMQAVSIAQGRRVLWVAQGKWPESQEPGFWYTEPDKEN